MTAWVDVGPVGELDRAGRLIARVGGREIGVLTGRDGRLTAVRNRCPHHGAPLCRGTLGERVGGSPGRWEPTGRLVVRCPWHGWEFDAATGVCVDEPALRVAVYEARVEDGRVLVAV
jgi:3-phenylpropionate/trans-cinnamate dioxygenase ferredoxin subunit